MALKQVLVLLAALCAVLGRPMEMDDPLKSSGTEEVNQSDPESDQVGTGSAIYHYPLGRPMAFIPVYYLPPHGFGGKVLKMRRPMQKEGEPVPTLVYSSRKDGQNVKPEKESLLQAGQKNVEGLPAFPSSMVQPDQSKKNLREESFSNMGQQQKMVDGAPVMNPQSNPLDSQVKMSSGSDMPITKNVDQQRLISLSEPSPLTIPRLKRSPQFRRPPPYGYDGYRYGYGGYGGYGGYDYPYYGDEVIDIDIQMY